MNNTPHRRSSMEQWYPLTEKTNPRARDYSIRNRPHRFYAPRRWSIQLTVSRQLISHVLIHPSFLFSFLFLLTLDFFCKPVPVLAIALYPVYCGYWSSLELKTFVNDIKDVLVYTEKGHYSTYKQLINEYYRSTSLIRNVQCFVLLLPCTR